MPSPSQVLPEAERRYLDRLSRPFPLVEVKDDPDGMGRGLFARAAIDQGQVVLNEPALGFGLSSLSHCHTCLTELDASARTAGTGFCSVPCANQAHPAVRAVAAARVMQWT